MNSIRIRVVYIPYARHFETAVAIGHITANSFREAIMKMLDKVRMYQDKLTILAREEELGRKMTQEELIDMIYAENGDGCDTVVSIINEDTREVYVDTDPALEEWTM